MLDPPACRCWVYVIVIQRNFRLLLQYWKRNDNVPVFALWKFIPSRTGGGDNSPQAFNPAGGAHIPALASPPVHKKRGAAQAEYGRLAALAYSPSDAMSQAKLCLAGMKKVQRKRRRIRTLKRDFAADVSDGEGGVVLQIFPAVSDLAA